MEKILENFKQGVQDGFKSSEQKNQDEITHEEISANILETVPRLSFMSRNIIEASVRIAWEQGRKQGLDESIEELNTLIWLNKPPRYEDERDAWKMAIKHIEELKDT